MSALLAALPLAKTIAEEGRDIILVMLAVGLIFLSVIGLGQLSRHMSHRRRARRS